MHYVIRLGNQSSMVTGKGEAIEAVQRLAKQVQFVNIVTAGKLVERAEAEGDASFGLLSTPAHGPRSAVEVEVVA